MKKIKIALTLVVLALLSCMPAQAKFGWGPKLGLTVDKMHISGGNFDADNRCGFTGGLTAEYIIPVVNFGFDISVMYSHMRAHVDYVDENGDKWGETTSGNFFEIPLHLKYMIGLPVIGKFVSPYIYSGPSVAFKLSGANSYMASKKTQWGWDLGVGLELINKLQVGAGYTFGMNKVASFFSSDMAGTATNEIKLKNNYWTVSVAWLFR